MTRTGLAYSLTAARAAALFTSDLSADVAHSRAEVAATVRYQIRVHGGSRGCAVDLAGEYGDHPDTAAPRMRWALDLVHTCYPPCSSAPQGQP